MWSERNKSQGLRIWLGSHRVLVISALNASLLLCLTCFLALMIEVSAKKNAHAQMGTAAARSREAGPSSAPAPQVTSADKPLSLDKPVSARRPTVRRARLSPHVQPLVEPPVRLGHRDYPVEVRERSLSRGAPDPAEVELPPEEPLYRSDEPEAPEDVPEAGVPPEGIPPEGEPAEGAPAEGTPAESELVPGRSGV